MSQRAIVLISGHFRITLFDIGEGIGTRVSLKSIGVSSTYILQIITIPMQWACNTHTKRVIEALQKLKSTEK